MRTNLTFTLAAGLALAAGALAQTPAPTNFVYRATPDSPAFEVTANGLTAIRLGDRVVAAGSWEASDASWMISPTGRAAARWAWAFPDRRLERIADDHVRVVHGGGEVVVTTDYLFSGEDAEIRTRVENRSAARTIEAVQCGDLSFTFDRKPDGLAMAADLGAFVRLGPERFHPSFHNNFGGSQLNDDGFGVGATPLRNGELPTVLWWPEDRQKPMQRPFHYVRALPIPPGSAMRVDCALRVSRNRDWRHLLEPYREHFRQTYGPVRYRADFRPFGYAQGSNGKAAEAPGNPYGWQWPPWRFDRIEGVTNFTHDAVAALKRANAQGILIWAHTGWNPRGCNFRPDFDVLPPEMESLMPQLAGPFREAGLRFGCLARPQIVTTDTWTQDTVLNLSADDPSQMAMAAKRFERMIAKGVTAYYIDTFGGYAQDARAMKLLRAGWGTTNVLTFTEFWSDVSLLYSGGYTQYNWDKKLKAYREFWWRDHLWEVCEWLSPGVQNASPGGIVEPYEDLPPPPASLDEAVARPADAGAADKPAKVTPPDHFRYLMAHHVTPLFYVGTRTTDAMADALREVGKEFLDDQGQWKQ